MNRTQKHVLIVEDDRDYSYVLATRCQLLGLKSTVIHDAQGALDQLLAETPDLLILDVNIPFQPGAVAAEHGAYLCSQLRHSLLKNVKTIMLSGSQDPATILECQKAGSVFIQKCPGSWGLLERTIQQLLAPAGPTACDPVEYSHVGELG